eukprot:TRINITY_DN2482_c0_g1_i3.p1 TRINITY_DN2482_c0_g1~~TRINITY_DN2482_c0_g1_i3.p1  ORF type:complete len:159 (+),score=7.54 TRINITY_DN2482_c0_g1_i3:510-986(+)
MQLPYIYRIFRSGTLPRIVPILVGSGTPAKYAALLAPYLASPENVFVISSDFCHWGSRFSYTFHDKSKGEIWQSIEWLDKCGMAAIESLDPQKFKTYRKKYSNTICGRSPIALLLHVAKLCTDQKFSIKFVKYHQSERCKRRSDSSVSYASGLMQIEN